jgi:preprotein translocase SecF subunit
MAFSRFGIIGNFKRRLSVSTVLVVLCALTFFTFMRFSIEFTGWLQLILNAEPLTDLQEQRIQEWLLAQWFLLSEIGLWSKDGYPTLLLQTSLDSADEISTVTQNVEWLLIEERIIASQDDVLEQSVIGPSVGDYVTRSALNALLLGMVFMGVYILFAFASMRDFISPPLLAWITIITIIFDILIPAGAYGVLMAMNQAAQVDVIFIIALLTIMGYSINDTIIILDRVRENFLLSKDAIMSGKLSRLQVFEDSVWQTMKRSIGTSLTTFLVVVVMFVFGTWVLKLFAFVLWFGVLAGSFSSIFLAAPLAYLLSWKENIADIRK